MVSAPMTGNSTGLFLSCSLKTQLGVPSRPTSSTTCGSDNGDYPFPATAPSCVSAHTAEDFCRSLQSRSESAQLICAAFGSAELFGFLIFTQENKMDATTRTNTPFPIVSGGADSTLSKTAASVHGAVDKM